ncbi:beta strand repeat-containing protein [Spirosoma sp. KNUC1025]|uniref:beta strand repeat-containing protein n=1 Tax=Spirosoma sp. KNUC1025 TaxID=2894082 RepID=UPI003863BC72|nr:hypothetical protein LN737_15855 [Spirosoma sp. KNUC1025]
MGSPVSVDPTDVATSVVIPFQVVDNAGKPSSNTATATLPLSAQLTLSGTVFNDADGGTIDGTATNVVAGNTFYVSTIDPVTDDVLSTTAVQPDGTYSLPVSPNTAYSVVLSTAPQTVGSPVSATLLTGAAHTAEGTAPAGDGTPDGQTGVSVVTTSVTGVNFGIDPLPTTGSGTATVTNAGGTTPVTVPATTFTSSSASDDTAPGSVTAIHVTSFPTNVTSLTINGTVYTSGDFPVNGVIVPTDGNGAPNVPVLVDPTNDSNPVVFTFRSVDNAGKEASSAGTATISSMLLTTISGKVWDDTDGNLSLNGSETATNAGGPLYVNLVDGANTVVASVSVVNDGSYSLSGVPTNVTGYKLVLASSATATTPGTLPTGWINTGESVDPSNTATQGSTLGVIELSTSTTAITDQNFGIEKLPTPGSGLATAVNAGGTSPVTVPASTFTSTTLSVDTAPGSVTAIRLTAFPSNVTSLTINGTVYTSGNFPVGGVTLPTDGSGNPTVPVLVDPADDGSSVVIPFVAIDNAGHESTTTGTATLNSDLVVTVSGTIWNDADGSITVTGSETGTNTGTTLYVNLVDGSGTVVGSTTVATNGTYSLNDVPTNVTGYRLVLASTATATTPGTLSTGWVNTGENADPSNTATQGNTLGVIELSTGTGAVTNQNFGVEQLPTPGSGSSLVANAGGTSLLSVPATTFTNTTPSVDTAPGSVTAIRVTAFPGNVTSLVIDGTTYTVSTFSTGGVVIPTDGSGAPTLAIAVDPTNDGSSVVIPFVAIDNAGKESTTSGAATLSSTPVVTVSGQVWNDVDGNLNQNGSETGTNAGGPLYVNLVDGSNTVVTSVSVAANGSYSLSGVPTNVTGYKLVLASSATGTTPGTLPTGWVNTGENVDGSNTATQGSTLGVIELSTGTSGIVNQNFGIEVLPSAGSGIATVDNSGGTNAVSVPASAFTSTSASTDTAPGSVTAIRISSFPGNVTSLTINGTTYTSGNFPTNGVTVPTDGNGSPSVPVLVDPTNDANPVVIPFVAIDNAGQDSPNTGTATLNSTLTTTVSGKVWDDADGSLSQNGSETTTNAGGPLYVNLVDGSNTVVASVSVAADGSYSLSGVPTNVTGYKLVLANTATATSPGTLPTGWVNTGESVDASNTATQSSTLGVIELTTTTSAVVNQNFGIEKLPTPGSGTATVANAGGQHP